MKLTCIPSIPFLPYAVVYQSVQASMATTNENVLNWHIRPFLESRCEKRVPYLKREGTKGQKGTILTKLVDNAKANSILPEHQHHKMISSVHFPRI